MLTREQYESKRQARYERLQAAAEKAQRESAASLAQANQMSSIIPLGQPILIGHHSEKADRKYRERIHNKYRKGYDLAQKAESYRERAESVRRMDAIFSDDPDALEKLEDKIQRLEARQEIMKQANKLIRKNDRSGLGDMGYSESAIDRLFTPDFCGRTGYPAYEITNNGANIRRLKERAQQVARKQASEDRTEEINGIRLEYSPSENRIRIFYPSRVSLETYQALKQHGFRVLRSEGEGAFSAYYNNNALYFIQTRIRGE